MAPKLPLQYWSASAMARAVANRDITSVHLTNLLLERIAAVNGALNAVVALDSERALERAKEADEALARGERWGPLHGIPMTIKDSLDTEGIISTGGTIGRSDHVPTGDATVVRRLKEAGAIILGKTNTPELTLSFETDNEVYGVTKNPFDVTRSPGGSSGGAASILAAGGSPLEVGSDYGGSIRVPSAFCGTAGIKPTAGRVPRTGHVFPFGGLNDTFQQLGPMARWVEDLVLALPILAGPDGIDPAIVPMPLDDPRNTNLSTLKIAYYQSAESIPATDAIQKTVREAGNALSDAGCSVQEVEAVAFKEAVDIGRERFAADGGAARERLLQEAGTPLGPAAGRTALDAKALDLLIARSFDVRSRIATAYRGFDVILSPANARTAPPSGWARDPANTPAFGYTIVHNLTGWPSGVVRCGTDQDGLPVAVQITAHPGHEDLVLAVALQLEQRLGGFRPPDEAALLAAARGDGEE